MGKIKIIRTTVSIIICRENVMKLRNNDIDINILIFHV